MYMRQTVAITGAAGFIGSHLCEKLLARDYDVVGIDNLLTGSPSNVAHLAGDGFRFIRQDINDFINIHGPVHFVLHFASPASPPDYLRFPLETLRVGADGTRNALELARWKSAPFLLASTSEVYGDPDVHPQPESYWGNVNPIGPRSVYDEAKRYAEALTTAYSRAYGLPVRIARIHNTYGPRMRLDDGRAIPNFITQALRRQALTVYGDGSQTRSLCYIDDLVDGILLLMQASCAQPVNLGNPNEMSIRSLAEQVCKAAGVAPTIVYRPLPTDDPRRRCPDITRAREMFGWEPRVPLSHGLPLTIEYFRSRLQIPA